MQRSGKFLAEFKLKIESDGWWELPSPNYWFHFDYFM